MAANGHGSSLCVLSCVLCSPGALFTGPEAIQVLGDDRRTRKGVTNLNSYVLFTYVGSGTQVTWYHHPSPSPSINAGGDMARRAMSDQ